MYILKFLKIVSFNFYTSHFDSYFSIKYEKESFFEKKTLFLNSCFADFDQV